MSWVATGTAAIGAVGSIGGGAFGDSPAGPAISGNFQCGDQNFAAQKDKSAVVIAVIVAVVAVIFGGLFLISRNRRKASANG